jgi:hypothetical protein
LSKLEDLKKKSKSVFELVIQKNCSRSGIKDSAGVAVVPEVHKKYLPYVIILTRNIIQM